MAQKGVQLDRKTFSCSICLDLLKDPVTVPCGHSFCKSCIEAHWDEEEKKKKYSCPQCRQTITQRPVLKKNTMLTALVEELKKTGLYDPPADPCYAGPEDVACDYCTGRKLKAIESCRQCLTSFCEEHLQPHFTEAPLMKHKLVGLSKQLPGLCSEDQHKDTVPAPAEKSDRQKKIQTNISWAFSQEGVSLPEPRSRAEFLGYSQEITLDPNTANKQLLLSEGNRRATFLNHHQPHPKHPDRFTGSFPQILSRESLSGRSYLEVTWRGRGVCVAVVYKSISRSGDECRFGFNDKSWALYCSPNRFVFRHNNVKLPVSGPKSRRVGLYLDHGAGLLSLYSVSETMTLLHRVQTTFTDPLFVGLRFCQGFIGCVPGDTAVISYPGGQ